MHVLGFPKLTATYESQYNPVRSIAQPIHPVEKKDTENVGVKFR